MCMPLVICEILHLSVAILAEYLTLESLGLKVPIELPTSEQVTLSLDPEGRKWQLSVWGSQPGLPPSSIQ